MKIYICDMENCNEEAWHRKIDICNGYSVSRLEPNKKKIIYKPFENPSLRKVDLCDKHFKRWCELTYTLFREVNMSEKKANLEENIQKGG